MEIEFTGEVWYWRGPAPFFFVSVPAEYTDGIKAIEGLVTYGWGMIPVRARIGATNFQTAMFPKDGKYVLPLKADIRKKEDLMEGEVVTVALSIELKLP
jgi:hypothetical protein